MEEGEEVVGVAGEDVFLLAEGGGGEAVCGGVSGGWGGGGGWGAYWLGHGGFWCALPGRR